MFGSNMVLTGNSRARNTQSTVSGGVTVQNGTFTLGSGAVLTTPSLNVTGGGIAAADATGTLNGSLNYTSSTSSTFLAAITGASSTVTMNNALAVLNLSGTNTDGGSTTITRGHLAGWQCECPARRCRGGQWRRARPRRPERDGHELQPAAGTVTTSGGPATLTVNQAGSTVFGGTLQDDGPLSLTVSSGELTLTGTNTYSGSPPRSVAARWPSTAS